MTSEEEFNQDSSKNNKIALPSIEKDFKSKEAVEKIWIVVNAIQTEREICSKREANLPIWYSYQTLSGNGRLSGDSVVRILEYLERDEKVIEILEIRLGDEFINLEELRKLEGNKKALEAWAGFGENKKDEALIKTLPGFSKYWTELASKKDRQNRIKLKV